MSVYTTVTTPAITSFLKLYQIGEFVSLQGIRDGIENTNYFLTTSRGEYVLTVFETLEIDEVPFCMELMHYVAGHGVVCADPVASNDGRYVNVLMDKPASIVSKLLGSSVETASQEQIAEIGHALAVLHYASRTFTTRRECRFGRQWRNKAARLVMDKLVNSERDLLQEEIRIQSLYRFEDLPSGIIHSDLFRDNALFVNDQLTGVIDFYDACHGPFMYDIAVVVNDWCRDEAGNMDGEKTNELLTAYNQKRRLTALERGAWPIMLRRAALRFWLSRLQGKYNPREGHMALQKDPEEFYNILNKAIEEETTVADLWIT